MVEVVYTIGGGGSFYYWTVAGGGYFKHIGKSDKADNMRFFEVYRLVEWPAPNLRKISVKVGEGVF